jgi:hypothetical protein
MTTRMLFLRPVKVIKSMAKRIAAFEQLQRQAVFTDELDLPLHKVGYR